MAQEAVGTQFPVTGRERTSRESECPRRGHQCHVPEHGVESQRPGTGRTGSHVLPSARTSPPGCQRLEYPWLLFLRSTDTASSSAVGRGMNTKWPSGTHVRWLQSAARTPSQARPHPPPSACGCVHVPQSLTRILCAISTGQPRDSRLSLLTSCMCTSFPPWDGFTLILMTAP